MKKMERGQPDLKTYIKENIPAGSNIGVDCNNLTKGKNKLTQNHMKYFLIS